MYRVLETLQQPVVEKLWSYFQRCISLVIFSLSYLQVFIIFSFPVAVLEHRPYVLFSVWRRAKPHAFIWMHFNDCDDVTTGSSAKVCPYFLKIPTTCSF